MGISPVPKIHFPDVSISHLQSIRHSCPLIGVPLWRATDPPVMEYRFTVFERSISLWRHDKLLANDPTGSPNNISATTKPFFLARHPSRDWKSYDEIARHPRLLVLTLELNRLKYNIRSKEIKVQVARKS